MFERRLRIPRKVVYEMHPEHETRNTRVSEYLRKYGQGKIDTLPSDTRPVVPDDGRSVDEKLSDTGIDVFNMATDELDVLSELNDSADRFEKAFADIELTKDARVKFENAMKILQDPNSSSDAKFDAYKILDDLEKKNKIART